VKQTRHVIPAVVRSALHERCGGRCEFDGQKMDHLDVHHRKQRSLGGLDTLDNLVSVCRDHHDAVHLYNDYDYGWLVHSWDTPALVPIHLFDGYFLLTPDGGMALQE
jgi:hypothetical protein